MDACIEGLVLLVQIMEEQLLELAVAYLWVSCFSAVESSRLC